MKVEQSSLLEVLAIPDVRFVIPAYQRRYSWQERQCEELWLDIHRAARRNEGHFSGTILYEEGCAEGAPFGDACFDDACRCEDRAFSIVDGQQRITTVTLMLVALRNHLASHPEREAKGLTADLVYHTYLIAGSKEAADLEEGKKAEGPEGSEGLCNGALLMSKAPSAVPKLMLSRLDAKSMERAVAGDAWDSILSHNISRNLSYFETLMAEDSFDPEAFMRGLGNLNVVMSKLDVFDDAQAVFESLNSKGLQLNIGDMVRNYLLASERHDEQTRLYLEYWTVIEGVFDPDPGSLKLDTMIKAWLSVRFTKVRARTPEDVYSAFKRYYDDEYSGDLEPVLVELRSFAMVWAENYRYHAVKKFRSMPWAVNGAQTLTSGYKLKKADNEEYAERVRQELRAMGREL